MSSDKLFDFLKEEKATKVSLLDDEEFEDDYDLIDPPKHPPKKMVRRKSKLAKEITQPKLLARRHR
jgi:hypothetical protein